MQNLHDDNQLDGLSRRAAEEFEPDHELHSWDKLRPHLEAALPQKKERKRRFIFWLFLALLIGGGVSFSMLWNRPAALSEVKKAPATEKKDVVVNKNEQQKTGQSNIQQPKKEESISIVPEQQSEHVIKFNRRTPDATTFSYRKSGKSTSLPTKLEEQPIPHRSKSEQTKSAQQKVQESKTGELKTEETKVQEQPATEQPKVQEPKTEQSNTEETKVPEQPTTEKLKVQDQKNEQAKTPEHKIQQPKSEPPIVKKENKTPSVSNHRWELGVAVAPDVSTVKFTHSQDPGSNIGLTIGYNLSKRFQLQTGVFFTSKNYKSYGKDYHPPKGYWTDYVKLETVTGECNMWDIPINIRYNIVPRQSSNFFATAGLSSYFMKKEDYDFFYYYNGNPVNRFRSYYTDNKHWFSVLNLSVGYERQVGKHVSLQAEPFFKQPLKGLGFGKIKLNSTGVYFSVKYKLRTAKK